MSHPLTVDGETIRPDEWPFLTRGRQLMYHYQAHTATPISYDELTAIDDMIRAALAVMQVEGDLLGGYRRELPFSDKIVLLVRGDRETLRLAIQILQEHDWVVTPLVERGEQDPLSWKGLVRFSPHHNVHFLEGWAASAAQYPYRKFFLTGSSAFIAQCQARATALGYTLTDEGMTDQTGTALPAASEGDIMNHLGIAYYPPSSRTGDASLVRFAPSSPRYRAPINGY